MIEQEIITLIKNNVSYEEPEIEIVDDWVSITTDIWEPDIYIFNYFEKIGLTFHGQLGYTYIFKIN